MKKTQLTIKVFNSVFELTVERDYYLSLMQCRTYVEKELEWPTATVTKVDHDGLTIYELQKPQAKEFPFTYVRYHQRAQ